MDGQYLSKLPQLMKSESQRQVVSASSDCALAAGSE